MDKVSRILILFNRFIKGEKINKADFASTYKINGRTFDRDIETIRNFLAEIHTLGEVCFNKSDNFYYLTECDYLRYGNLNSIEAIILLRILMSSKALRKDELLGIVRSVLASMNKDKSRLVINTINDELEQYMSADHGRAIIKMLDDLNKVIQKRIKIKLKYWINDKDLNEQDVLPLEFIFYNNFFYLIALIDGDTNENTVLFRCDKIDSFEMSNERYSDKLKNKVDYKKYIY